MYERKVVDIFKSIIIILIYLDLNLIYIDGNYNLDMCVKLIFFFGNWCKVDFYKLENVLWFDDNNLWNYLNKYLEIWERKRNVY